MERQLTTTDTQSDTPETWWQRRNRERQMYLEGLSKRLADPRQREWQTQRQIESCNGWTW
jgi:hypothetical protein